MCNSCSCAVPKPILASQSKRILALAELRNDHYPDAIASATKAIEEGDLSTPNELIKSIASAELGQLDDARAFYTGRVVKLRFVRVGGAGKISERQGAFVFKRYKNRKMWPREVY